MKEILEAIVGFILVNIVRMDKGMFIATNKTTGKQEKVVIYTFWKG